MNQGPSKIMQIAVTGDEHGDTLYAVDQDGKLHIANVVLSRKEDAKVVWRDMHNPAE